MNVPGLRCCFPDLPLRSSNLHRCRIRIKAAAIEISQLDNLSFLRLGELMACCDLSSRDSFCALAAEKVVPNLLVSEMIRKDAIPRILKGPKSLFALNWRNRRR